MEECEATQRHRLAIVKKQFLKCTFSPWSGTKTVKSFLAPVSPLLCPSTSSRSFSQASPQNLASKPSLKTDILPQLSHPTGTTMRSRSSVFGLCWKGKGFRTGAGASDPPPIAGEGGGGTKSKCKACCRRTWRVVG